MATIYKRIRLKCVHKLHSATDFVIEICSVHFGQIFTEYVKCALSFQPVQIALLPIVGIMDLTIDETLPQPFHPGVMRQVVEAELGAHILACIIMIKFKAILKVDLVCYDGNFSDVSWEAFHSPAPDLLLSSNSKGVPGGKGIMVIKVTARST